MESKTTKKHIVLLPRYFKKIGFSIIILALAIGVLIKLLNVELLLSQKELFKIYTLNAFILGLFFISFSRDKTEDEMTIALRLKAMAFTFAFAVIGVLLSPLTDLLFKDPIQNETAQQMVMTMLFVYLIMYYLQKIKR